MGAKKSKKGLPWPEPRFEEDPDIRAYATTIAKDLTAIKQHAEKVESGLPPGLTHQILDALIGFAQRVHKAPTIEALAHRLARVESHMEKTQKEVSQTSREVLTTKSNTNRLIEAICAPSPPGSRILKTSMSFGHVTGSSSSESYVHAWGRKVPSHPLQFQASACQAATALL
ncbi:hypothetical protein BGW36DRAFT_360207 [Talaromyces proteolyticus]|uniref:Uncharacterized protein n=1 Tax=Talaromyces proteolyticus TaxID=1131652 RepID=A0AAD4KR06_9EURO|nr:uncharacterized protein BGW36DRAFT_360207 [Talaromyces proteolyticus]KAH8696362.1 hypothetical protein BGW36DRAFT_360207 [Talaromyces proteolyticus]